MGNNNSQEGSKEIVIRKVLSNEMPKGNTIPDIFNKQLKQQINSEAKGESQILK